MQITCLKTQTFRTKKSTIIQLLSCNYQSVVVDFRNFKQKKKKKNENELAEWLSVLFWKQQLAQTCVIRMCDCHFLNELTYLCTFVLIYIEPQNSSFHRAF